VPETDAACFTFPASWPLNTDDPTIRMKPLPESSPQEVLAGLVERVTFHNVENGFCVLRAKARGHRELVTVVGHAAIISAGEWITATGDWVNDRTHGQQFKARFLRTSAPTSADGIEKYLSSGMIRGVGPASASARATCPCRPVTAIRRGAIVVVQGPPPPFIFEIPSHGTLDAGVEGFASAPTEFGLELGGVDCVTVVMTRTIGHELDQSLVRRAVGPQRIHDLRDAADDRRRRERTSSRRRGGGGFHIVTRADRDRLGRRSDGSITAIAASLTP
jgi:hypothetical protein